MREPISSLVAFLRARYSMAAQGAAALPHAIANLQSLWSPALLLADADSKLRVVDECVRTIESGAPGRVFAEQVLKVLALAHASHKDYRESWKP